MKENNPNRPKMCGHLYRMLIITGSGSGETNSSFDLISYQQILIKFINMLRIHMKQNINY